ncbi:hypothetical protein AAVH_12186 [Aphelenchoides avenae]|nr:hypothetical protein AAVH_12186 [Aphelenchus avenae]
MERRTRHHHDLVPPPNPLTHPVMGVGAVVVAALGGGGTDCWEGIVGGRSGGGVLFFAWVIRVAARGDRFPSLGCGVHMGQLLCAEPTRSPVGDGPRLR